MATETGALLGRTEGGRHEARFKVDDTVGVSGCGPGGLCVILAAWQHGPRKVFAIDQFQNRPKVVEHHGKVVTARDFPRVLRCVRQDP